MKRGDQYCITFSRFSFFFERENLKNDKIEIG